MSDCVYCGRPYATARGLWEHEVVCVVRWGERYKMIRDKAAKPAQTPEELAKVDPFEGFTEGEE